MNRLKLFLQSESAKLKEMNGQEKRWYIWEYYKIQICVLVFCLIMFGSLINTWFINPPQKAYVHVAWLASFHTMEQMEALANILTEAIVEDEREAVFVTSFVASGADPSFDHAMQQRFMAMLAAGELHVFIVDSDEYLQDMVESDLIRPLNPAMEYLAEIDPALHERLKPKLVSAEGINSITGELVSGYLGISLYGSPVMTALDIPTQNIYLCKVIVGGHDYQTAEILQALFNISKLATE